MKTILKTSIFLFFTTIVLSGCTKTLEYTIIYRGFIAIENNEADFSSDETLIFNTSKEWDEFTQKYFPTLPRFLGKHDVDVDFSSQKIVCKICMPIDDLYNISSDIEKITSNENVINIELKNNNDKIYINGIEHKITYPFVILTTIKKAN